MKKQPQTTIDQMQKQLSDLKLKRAFDKTTAHDEKIKELENSLDALFWGRKNWT